MAVRYKKVVPGSITEPYKQRQGDFSPNLVGNQFTEGSTLFTLGNFQITTNLSPKQNKSFETSSFSKPYTLTDLNLTTDESNILTTNNLNVFLNLDSSRLENYAYYGSLRERIRVSIENILSLWPASLPINKLTETGYKNTVLSFNYDSNKKTSTFLIPIITINNKFNLKYSDTQVDLEYDTTNPKNLVVNYSSYSLYTNNNLEYKILNYSGSSTNYQYITIEVEGNPFPTLSGLTNFDAVNYHLKPNNTIINSFYYELDDLELSLLNRTSQPKYKFDVIVNSESELGTTTSTKKEFIWSTSDGYNIDYDGPDYTKYITDLINIADEYDQKRTNIILRKLVSTSIIEFDTEGDDETGGKVYKLLRLYGREFDEVKKYIDGISFVNTVTYNKKDNTPDELIKSMAQTLGFDTLQSVSTNNLLNYISKTNIKVFSGLTGSMSIDEMDTELWRRLVINAWWLFKSKGTRKVIEFFLSLFNIQDSFIDIDEYVYLADKKLNQLDVQKQISLYLDIPFENVDMSEYPINEDGFPTTKISDPNFYYQMKGFWYNGGTTRTTGNNPHEGDYDYGSTYVDRFRCFIDNFVGLISGTSITTGVFNNYTDFNQGSIEDGEIINISNVSGISSNLFSNQQGFTTEDVDVIDYGGLDLYVKNLELISAGQSGLDRHSGLSSLRVKVKGKSPNTECLNCPSSVIYQQTGLITSKGGLTEVCCSLFNGYSLGPVVGTVECYWCPPDMFIGRTPLQNDPNTVVLTYNGDTISEQCCFIRGGSFSNGECTYTEPIIETCPPTYTLNNLGVAEYQSVPLNESCCTSFINTGSQLIWNGIQCINNTPIVNVCDEYTIINGRNVVLVDNNSTPISEECCTENGFYPQSNGSYSGCYNCPIISINENQPFFEYQDFDIVEVYPFKITNKDGSDLSVECCTGVIYKTSGGIDPIEQGSNYRNGVCYMCDDITEYNVDLSPTNYNGTNYRGEIINSSYGGYMSAYCCYNFRDGNGLVLNGYQNIPREKITYASNGRCYINY